MAFSNGVYQCNQVLSINLNKKEPNISGEFWVMYDLSMLKNGLKVATCKLPNTRSVAVGLWVKTGGRYEPKNLNGISHFFEHIVFKGSKKRTCRQIKESIEGLGGMLNGFTTEEVTCFLAKVLEKHLPAALDVLVDMLLNPLICQTDIDKERLVIFEEIKMYFDLPHHLALLLHISL